MVVSPDEARDGVGRDPGLDHGHIVACKDWGQDGPGLDHLGGDHHLLGHRYTLSRGLREELGAVKDILRELGLIDHRDYWGGLRMHWDGAGWQESGHGGGNGIWSVLGW